MLASVVLWFSSFNEVITSDKFCLPVWPDSPALSLVLSMALRFIPKFKAQLQSRIRSADMYWKDTKPAAYSAASEMPFGFFHYGHMEPGKRD